MNASTQPLSPYTAPPQAKAIVTHTLSVLVDNEPGVLARVVGMFSGRGYNIASLTVAEVAHTDHLSRITIVTSGTLDAIEQVTLQLARGIDASIESFVFELTGAASKIDHFVELMRPIGLVEVSRTGVAAIVRGPGKTP